MAWRNRTFLSPPGFRNLAVAAAGALLFLLSLYVLPGWGITRETFGFLHALSLFVMAVGFFWGKHMGYKIVGTGFLLNGLIILLNGHMPVERTALIAANDERALGLLEANKVLTHALADGATRLSFLDDRIPFASPITSPRVISIGDICIAIGLFILVSSAVTYIFRRQHRHEMDR